MVTPRIETLLAENLDGTITEKRRQYNYPSDGDLPAYVDSLDLLGEWLGKPAAQMDAEMQARYERWAQQVLNPAQPDPPAPVDPQAATDALVQAQQALQQAQDAISALLPS